MKQTSYDVVIRTTFTSTEGLSFEQVKESILDTLQQSFHENELKLSDNIEISEASEDISAFGLSIGDVIEFAGSTMDTVLTRQDAKEILEDMICKASFEDGVSWYTLRYYIQEHINNNKNK